MILFYVLDFMLCVRLFSKEGLQLQKWSMKLKDEMEKMQDRSHRYCFVANSLSDEVDVKINI